AAGQTLVMLTGGVDLSVATTATAAAFMISSYANHGAFVAIVIALGVGLGIGLVNGTGVAVFRVNPLIMTLGVSTVTLGLLTGYSGTILGALILTVLDSLLTILNASAATKQILYGAIILALAALYARAVSSD